VPDAGIVKLLASCVLVGSQVVTSTPVFADDIAKPDADEFIACCDKLATARRWRPT